MHVVLLDLSTGKRRDCFDWKSGDVELGASWWMDGDWACDCNRALAWGGEVAQTEQRHRLGLDDNQCLGATRWLIVDVHGDLEGRTRADILAEANSWYPDAVVQRHVSVS